MSRTIMCGRVAIILMLQSFTLVVVVPTTYAVSLEWVRQLGTTGVDTIEEGSAVSADGLGHVYLAGATSGSLQGSNYGGLDAFLSKYDSSGILQWTRQLGTTADDVSFGASADGLGNVYVTGYTVGKLDEDQPDAGAGDVFLVKYDSDGNRLWTRQFGTAGVDAGSGVFADGTGKVYITGRVQGSLNGQLYNGGTDAFVSKFTATGDHIWTRQLGTPSTDESNGVSTDGLGNVYITGKTEGDLGSVQQGLGDAFVSKFDSIGNLQWTRQFGTSSEESSEDISVDDLGTAFLVGYTNGGIGGPNLGAADAFVARVDSGGNVVWTRQLGTTVEDRAYGITIDDLGGVYITGDTYGDLGETSAGPDDAFLAKYNTLGALQWTTLLGSTGGELGRGVSADGMGSLYIAGLTSGSLGGQIAGPYDAFVAKYFDPIVPEPSTPALFVLAMVVTINIRINRRAIGR